MAATQKSGRGLLFWGTIVAALAWMAAIAARAYGTWPHIPMDVSAIDPATQAAFHDAVGWHLTWYGLAAVVPAGLAVMLATLLTRRRG
ncbi:MAG: hypothetical protein KDJ37_01420 [Hyphomicrobiaceae bacterium]|nr:hypothetical protein [Hyphomicrobiaceae bacterium]